MEKKLSIKDTGKVVIGALREGKKSWTDLKKLEVKGKVIPDKSLGRLLEYLEHWGLAAKETNYWVWHENLRVFSSKEEYDLAIEHSRKLRPALKEMSIAAFNFEDPLFDGAKEHLRTGYPEIHQRLVKLLKLMDDKKKELLKKYSQEISDLHLGYPNYEYHPFQLLGFLSVWKPEPEYLEARDRMLRELKPLFDVYRDLSGDLSLLALKIEMGEPLEGACLLCPKVKIMKEGKKQNE